MACRRSRLGGLQNDSPYGNAWIIPLPDLSGGEAFDLKQNGSGFIVTDSKTTETSLRNVFAIGEVAQRMHPCCVTAMADGVVAAKEIQHRIEAGSQIMLDQSALVPGRFDVLASYRR